MSTFKDLQKNVNKRFIDLKGQALYLVTTDYNELFDAYLAAFPEEFRQEHNCSCCRHFLRDAGGIVTISDDYKVNTLWDFEMEYPFNKVPAALKAVVEKAAIEKLFLYPEKIVGVEKNFNYRSDGNIIEYNHFWLRLPDAVVCDGIGGHNSVFTARFETTLRSLNELSLHCVEEVLELINQNSLYRGAEFRETLKKFLDAKKTFIRLPQKERTLYAIKHHKAGLNIRNSAIGSLLVDLSEGRDLESAVASYESKVAPSNYKRPTALVTPRMIEQAKQELDAEGLLPSLARRHAQISDLPVSKVLFANRNVFRKSSEDVFGTLLAESVVDVKTFSKVEEVPYKTFIENVLPDLTSVELLLEPRLEGNLVNLLTAENADAPLLFKWDSPISWSYHNNMADSMKTKVKAAGGKVDGELRVSLEWYNFDDLDLHLREPSGSHIYFSNKQARFGSLDVDMNVSPDTRNPVENIIYPISHKGMEGRYEILVNNYTHRERIDVGFSVELECRGTIHTFNYASMVSSGATVSVAKFNYSQQDGVTNIHSDFTNTKVSSKEIWNVKTNTFIPVDVITFSPNYWEGNETGNQHLFFMMPEVVNKESSRGIYNEFLRESLGKHRKVFELLGEKTKVPAEARQMAGLGFSLTQRNFLYAKVSGKITRVIKIIF